MAGQAQQWPAGALVATPQPDAADQAGLRIQLVSQQQAMSMSPLVDASTPAALQQCVYPMVLTPLEPANNLPPSAAASAAPAMISLAMPGQAGALAKGLDAGVVEKMAAVAAAGDAANPGRGAGSLSDLPPAVKLQVLEAMGLQGLISLGGNEGGGPGLGPKREGEARGSEVQELMQQQLAFTMIPNGGEDAKGLRRGGRSPQSPEDRHTSAKERNRLAQQRFRERQKQRIAGLQNKVTELTAHVHVLQAELDHLRKEREALLMELKNRGVAWPVQQ